MDALAEQFFNLAIMERGLPLVLMGLKQTALLCLMVIPLGIAGGLGFALLSLARTYLFAIPLIFALPLGLGEQGIWLALPIADVALVGVTLLVLKARARQAAWGLFQPA